VSALDLKMDGSFLNILLTACSEYNGSTLVLSQELGEITYGLDNTAITSQSGDSFNRVKLQGSVPWTVSGNSSAFLVEIEYGINATLDQGS